MENILKINAEKLLSSVDIKKLLLVSLSDKYNDSNCPPVIAYHNLKDINNVEELFYKFTNKPTDAVILLYEREENNGHYTCLLKKYDSSKNLYYEFFDSYGTSRPDSELKYSDYNDSFAGNHTNYDHSLYYLLKDTHWVSNKYRFQKLEKTYEDNTCGRWVSVRIIFSFLDCEGFNNLFKDEKNKSLEVVKMTFLIT